MTKTQETLESETPESMFRGQVEQSFDFLLGHAIWNVGMPYERPHNTPLRWALTQYSNEDSPRNIQLWIKLDEQRFIYLTKILQKVEADDGVWEMHTTENQDDGTALYTNAKVGEDGQITGEQIKKVQDDGDSGKILAMSEYDYAEEEQAQILPQLMPDKQEAFMQSLDLRALKLAHIMQTLGL
jgi:hypothetical protein